ncbi:MAG: hypothetical protein JXQ67_08355 [Campylobacterales bacterium]|nr:hypothetical protein [Campylobacterales bacterium]
MQKLKSVMLPSIQKSIKYGYIRDAKLHFVISSTLNKYDKDNIINTIKMILNGNMIQKNEMLLECIDEQIEDVIVKVDHRPQHQFQPYTTTAHKLSYYERASGGLKIEMQDEKLQKLAEEIQTIIKEKQCNY